MDLQKNQQQNEKRKTKKKKYERKKKKKADLDKVTNANLSAVVEGLFIAIGTRQNRFHFDAC